MSLRNFRLIKVLLFAMVTTLDLNVRAFTFEEPKNCTKSDDKCAMHVDAARDSLNLSTGIAALSAGSSAVRESNNTLTVVRGVVKVSARSETIIKTLYGELSVVDGEVIVDAKDNIVKFTNLSSELKYQPRGESKKHELPIGFSTYFAGITSLGIADTGYPKLAEVESLLHNWSQFYTRAETDKFVDDVQDFMKVWRVAAERVGPWYLDTVQREIAAEKAQVARLARLRAEREIETQKYRKMLRERVFGE